MEDNIMGLISDTTHAVKDGWEALEKVGQIIPGEPHWRLDTPGIDIVKGIIIDVGLFLAGKDHRNISKAEKEFAETVFGDSLPSNKSIILTEISGIDDRPFVLPSSSSGIYVNLGKGFNDPINFSSAVYPVPGQQFIHELTHVWQVHQGNSALSFICEGIVGQILDIEYNPGVTGKDWSDYNMEQQATIVDQWFAGKFLRDPNFAMEQRSPEHPFYRYIIKDIRGIDIDIRLITSNIFNSKFYLKYHPELLTKFGSDGFDTAFLHWLSYGIKEGRRCSCEFDVQFYLNYYPDLVNAFGDNNYSAAYKHWYTAGINEGRRCSREFDVSFYLDYNPDLVKAFGANNYFEAYNHWLAHGIKEGRRCSREFDVSYYLKHNPDLVLTFGAKNYRAAYDHWLTNGINEGRRCSREFDVSYYLNHHRDLVEAFGATNYAAAYEHWFTHGLSEGRKSSAEFDISFYLNHYPDLIKTYGPKNYSAAYNHWFTSGQKEGRVCV